MKNYCAKIDNNVVTEIIVGDYEWVMSNLAGDWHDLGGDPLLVGVYWTYDANTNTFNPPPPPPLERTI